MIVVARQDGAFALAESDTVAVALADTSEDDRVTIFEELAGLATWKLDLIFAAPTKFKHRSILGGVRARDSTCAKHVTNAHIATSDGMMSNSLSYAEVEVAHITISDDVGGIHGWCLDCDLKVYVVAAQVVVLKVG